jgi:hypothetical protein
MITTGASNLKLNFNVVIDGIALNFVDVRMISVELHENMHNMAVIHVAGIPADSLTDYINRPILIEMGIGELSQHTFYGTIIYLEPESKTHDGLVNGSPFQITKIFCMGPTFAMRGKKTRAWDKRTLPQLAGQLASEYGLSVSVPNSTYVYPRLVQNGKSDWEILVEAVEYQGFRMMSRGTHIEIWDPYTLLNRNGGAIPITTLKGTQGDVTPDLGQVIEFKAQVGASTPGGQGVPNTVHVLADGQIKTINLVESSGYGDAIPRPYSNEANENLTSVEQAETFLGAKFLPISGSCTVVGNFNIQPGTLVNLFKYDSKIDGVWIVESAKHEMFRGSGLSYLTLRRDSLARDGAITITRPATPPIIPPQPVLRDGRWRSSQEVIDVYA